MEVVERYLDYSQEESSEVSFEEPEDDTDNSELVETDYYFLKIVDDVVVTQVVGIVVDIILAVVLIDSGTLY